jgi:magnesium transporter
MEKDLDNAVLTLSREYLTRYPTESVEALGRMRVEKIADILQTQHMQQAVRTWERLSPDIAAEVLSYTEESFAIDMLSAADPSASARILMRLPSKARDRFLNMFGKSKRDELTELLQYPEGSAGSLMDTRYIIIHDDITAKEALQRLRKVKPRFTRHFFLLDKEENLKGMVDIQELAIAPPNELISAIASPVISAVLPVASREEVVEQLEKYKLADLPVVDVNGKLAGVIRYNALMNAVREETSADILTMVGVSKNERALSKTGFVVRKRLPWLQINLLTAFLAASVVGIFEGTIAKFTALAVLLPVVAGQSGNAGAQALAVTMRGLALREIRTQHWRRVALKEIGAGFINGLAIALTTAVGVYFWSSSKGLSLVIGVSMVISMIAAAVSGVVIPMLLSAAGQDPAQSSSIILTTVTDVVGFFSFLGIATLLAGML